MDDTTKRSTRKRIRRFEMNSAGSALKSEAADDDTAKSAQVPQKAWNFFARHKTMLVYGSAL
jgi:hypothetical protein